MDQNKWTKLFRCNYNMFHIETYWSFLNVETKHSAQKTCNF
ncbi:conserved hypothetical protein [Vibrio chagasii]|nr:conserved hypothetical protein [Vibrio chagasii]CAH6796833.1 conserved hypothetical protein [Vibrio chagasii]CAH6889601.1 conserved hypothetical protein [Vibrio chagasii]CAH7101038.1 conserved hypothetical protein [Vibrio chagasii]CAH7118300.1 conserved hypothetical protein [Vibrio chagasii]